MEGELKVVCVDMDDTLWDLSRTYVRAHEAWLACVRQAPGGAALAEAFRDPFGWEALYEDIFRDFPGIGADFSRVRREAFRRACLRCGVDANAVVEPSYQAWFAERNRPAFYEDAVSVLKDLRALGLVLGAVTETDAVLEEIPELEGLFDFVVLSSAEGTGKSDPAFYRAAVRRAAEVLRTPLTPEECVMIGDNYKKDVLVPHAVGMRTLWFDNPASYPRTVMGELPPDPPLVCIGQVKCLADVLEVLRPHAARGVAEAQAVTAAL
mmetsp:Transcript_104929/g.327229  ORF Transcript_104929/g.327229 Transcript_104929/m.327229 type:complete len:266 (+) Transcript_104929:67-864(+)